MSVGKAERQKGLITADTLSIALYFSRIDCRAVSGDPCRSDKKSDSSKVHTKWALPTNLKSIELSGFRSEIATVLLAYSKVRSVVASFNLTGSPW